jgi:hypothetical protein
MWHWYNHEGGVANVVAYLMTKDLSDFDPKAPPPHRQDLEHLIKTLSDEERIEFTESIATDKAIEREFGIKMAQGPYGHGYVPISKFPHASFFCGHCGSLGPWNGARCMTCGMLDDGD